MDISRTERLAREDGEQALRRFGRRRPCRRRGGRRRRNRREHVPGRGVHRGRRGADRLLLQGRMGPLRIRRDGSLLRSVRYSGVRSAHLQGALFQEPRGDLVPPEVLGARRQSPGTAVGSADHRLVCGFMFQARPEPRPHPDVGRRPGVLPRSRSSGDVRLAPRRGFPPFVVGGPGAGVSGDPLCHGPPDHPHQRAGTHPHLGLHRRHLLQGISGYRQDGFNGALHGRPSDADEPRRPRLCPEPRRASLCPGALRRNDAPENGACVASSPADRRVLHRREAGGVRPGHFPPRGLFVKTAAPVVAALALYCAVFWNSDSKFASPVRLVKTGFGVDPETAGERYYSNLYREIEKYDLARTVQDYPVLGIGFGNKYEMPLPLVKIDFPLRDYISHDQILWVIVKMGAVGFCLFCLFFNSFACRAAFTLTRLRDPYLRAVVAVAVAAIVNQLVVSNYDLQLTYYRNMVFLGTFMGLLPVCGHIAAEKRSPHPEGDA